MSAQLPYLPPFDRAKRDLASVATGVAEDVRAAQSTAAKAGTVARGLAATLPIATRLVNDSLPGESARTAVTDFLSNLILGPRAAPAPAAPVAPRAPALNLPALSTPAPAAEPATQTPVVAAPTTVGSVQATRSGNQVTVRGDAPAPAPVEKLPLLIRRDPVKSGALLQAEYAAAQRQAVLAAAEQAAASGNPDNASYRYAAALNALPALSGSNNFAGNEANLAAQLASSGEQERSNIRTTTEMKRSTMQRAEEVRRNMQPVVIAEEINPDPTTRPFAPTIKKYGFVTRNEDGSIEVRDMQGSVQKPPAPPVSRSEFITKNKKANPGMSEADIGREWDKKYGGKG